MIYRFSYWLLFRFGLRPCFSPSTPNTYSKFELSTSFFLWISQLASPTSSGQSASLLSLNHLPYFLLLFLYDSLFVTSFSFVCLVSFLLKILRFTCRAQFFIGLFSKKKQPNSSSGNNSNNRMPVIITTTTTISHTQVPWLWRSFLWMFVFVCLFVTLSMSRFFGYTLSFSLSDWQTTDSLWYLCLLPFLEKNPKQKLVILN